MERHVYQNSEGGCTYVPMEQAVGFYGSSSPLLCKVVSMKYGITSSSVVKADMSNSHSRLISNTLVQNIASRVGSLAQETRGMWTYSLPMEASLVKSIGVGLDGTTGPIKGEGYKEVMCGNLSFYDVSGERLHSIYIGHSPESGKESFYSLLSQEIAAAKKLCKEAAFVGIADGAAANWTFLEKEVSIQILDFYHVAEYVSEVAKEMFHNKKNRKQWLDNALHELKHTAGFARKLLAQFQCWQSLIEKPSIQAILQKTITYFSNHISQMDYPTYLQKGFPIGSGVTESACKVLVKQRFNLSGCQWSRKQMDNLLTIRALILSGRWNQFWQNLQLMAA